MKMFSQYPYKAGEIVSQIPAKCDTSKIINFTVKYKIIGLLSLLVQFN